MKKHKFIVEIEMPEGVNITEMKSYIHRSLKVMCGSLCSYNDPSFDPNSDAIKVVHATRAKAAELLKKLIK